MERQGTKKIALLTVAGIAVVSLAACGSSSHAAKPTAHHLTGEFYGNKTDTQLEFQKGEDWVILSSNITTKEGWTVLSGDLKYKISGDKITFYWDNKYEKKYGFKPGQVLGKGVISKDNRTIKITKDYSDKPKSDQEYYDFLDPSFGKDNANAKKAAAETKASKDKEDAWKNAAQSYINQNLHTMEGADVGFTKAQYDKLVVDSYDSPTKGSKGQNITDVMALGLTPSSATPGFYDDAQLLVDYGNKDDGKGFVELAFNQQSNGSYTLVKKTEQGLK